MHVTVIPTIVRMLGMIHKRKIRTVGDQRKNQDYPNFNIIEISQKANESPRKLRNSDSSERPSVNAGVKNLHEES